MATINIRIKDELKARTDSVLTRLNISQTEIITRLYQYIADKGRLPFNDPDLVLRDMQATLHSVAEISKGMLIAYEEEGFIRENTRQLLLHILNKFTRDFDQNYPAMKEASGGHLHSVWNDASNGAKGIIYMLTLGSKMDENGRIRTTLSELGKAVNSIVAGDLYIRK